MNILEHLSRRTNFSTVKEKRSAGARARAPGERISLSPSARASTSAHNQQPARKASPPSKLPKTSSASLATIINGNLLRLLPVSFLRSMSVRPSGNMATLKPKKFDNGCKKHTSSPSFSFPWIHNEGRPNDGAKCGFCGPACARSVAARSREAE